LSRENRGDQEILFGNVIRTEGSSEIR